MNDPRTALRTFSAALMALVLYGLQYFNAPEPMLPLIAAVWAAGLGLSEVWYDCVVKAKP